MIENFFRELLRFGAKQASPFDYGYHCQASDTDPRELAARIGSVRSDKLFPEIVPPCHYFRIGSTLWALEPKHKNGRLICDCWKAIDQ